MLTEIMEFKGLTRETRVLQADPGLLTRIYEAARVGMKGDSLAYAAGVLPEELRTVQQHDRLAKIAEEKGRADGEFKAASAIMEAVDNGNPDAALNMLRYAHRWAATQQVQIQSEEKISITLALQAADNRVFTLVNHPAASSTGHVIDASPNAEVLSAGRDGNHLPVAISYAEG